MEVIGGIRLGSLCWLTYVCCGSEKINVKGNGNLDPAGNRS